MMSIAFDKHHNRDITIVDAETLTTLFLEISVDFQASHYELRDSIEIALRSHGEPLRWAITSVDQGRQKVHVEAVVTRDMSVL
ncbi:MAG: hypothetical protein AAGA75_07300 [Cyanobacteria bacterium P01_E01_bin.6]